jgi:SpoVK/Ycf46/Vps4 family AAA+-type ATPase
MRCAVLRGAAGGDAALWSDRGAGAAVLRAPAPQQAQQPQKPQEVRLQRRVAVRCRPRWQASGSRALAPARDGAAAAEALVSETAAAALGGDVNDIEVEQWVTGPLPECESVELDPAGADPDEVEGAEEAAREEALKDVAEQQGSLLNIKERRDATFDVRFGAVVAVGAALCIDAFGHRFAQVRSLVLRGGAAGDGPPCTTALGLVGPSTRITFAARSRAGLDTPLLSLVPSEAAWVDGVVGVLGEYTRVACRELVRWLRAALASCERQARAAPPLVPASEAGYGRGVLLHGPSGVGKSELLRELLRAGGLAAVQITPDMVFRPEKGQGERALLDALGPGCGALPRVVVLDRVEVLQEGGGGEHDAAQYGNGGGYGGVLGAALLVAIEHAFARAGSRGALVIGVTDAPPHVARALLHPRRLGTLVRLDAPRGAAQRLDLAVRLLARHSVCADGELALALAARANGLVPAELDAAVRDLALRRRKQQLQEQEPRPEVSAKQPLSAAEEARLALEGQTVAALKSSKLAALRGGGSSGQTASLDDLRGMCEAVRRLRTSVLLPLQQPERLAAVGLTRGGPRGVLLHGPSGNGKTLLARALAASLDNLGLANFVAVRCPELVSKVVGESEANIAGVFARVRSAAPCVLFLDQVEAIAGKRGADGSSEQTMDRLLSCLLTLMDGIAGKTASAGVVVLAATDARERLDPAILRPGRFDSHILVDAPASNAERADVLAACCAAMPLPGDRDMLLAAVAARVSAAAAETGAPCSRAVLAAVAREAAMHALREDMATVAVESRHFDRAIADYYATGA